MIRIYQATAPGGWHEEELRKLVELKRGYSWEKEDETLRPGPETTPVIRIMNIQERLILEPMLFLRNVSEEDLASCAVSKGWILFVASNGNEDRIGDSALIDQDMKMVFASFLMAIKPRDPEVLLPEFLSLWLKLHWVHELFSKTAQKGSGLGNFSWGAVKGLPVRYPSPDEQRQIVRAVREADRYVELTTSRTPTLRSLIDGPLLNAGHSEDVDGEPPETEKPSLGDADTELETAVRLRFCLRERLVSGERLLAVPADRDAR
jgi:hypothetical protein